jgi:hypothetical protein
LIMMKSLTIATAALALGGTALFASMPAEAAASAKSSGVIIEARLGGPAHVKFRKPSRVSATGVARGALLPYFLKKAQAQRKAINNWSAKVRLMYGSQYASWSRANAKSTSCNRLGTAVTCRVSAIPDSPYKRYGLLD